MLLPETEVDFSPEVSCFSVSFFIFGRYFGKKLEGFHLFSPIFQIFPKKWPISLEFQPEVVPFPPEVSWFFKFSRLHLSILAKSSENLTFFGQFFRKYVWEFSQIFSIKFLMRFRSSGEKLALKRSKTWEFLQT